MAISHIYGLGVGQWGRSMGYISGGIGGFASHRCEIAFVTNSTGKIISNQFSDTRIDSLTCYRLFK